MAPELNFGPYVDLENGKKVVKDLTFGNPTPEGVVLTTLDSAVNWMRKGSIWPMTFGLACCAIEMMSMGAARFDIARFGAEVFRPSPRQSDLMIIAGRVSNKMAPVIRQLWEQMPEPKWVISMGACATSGGVFNNYALVQSVNQVIPSISMSQDVHRALSSSSTASLCFRKKYRKSAVPSGKPLISASCFLLVIRRRFSENSPPVNHWLWCQLRSIRKCCLGSTCKNSGFL